MHRREFLLGALAAAAMPAAAWGQVRSRNIEYALIASFTCGKCGNFDPHMRSLENQLGGTLHFVPVTERMDDVVVLGWYGMQKLTKNEARLRATMFKLTQRLMLAEPTIDDLIQFLQLEGIEIPPDQMREAIESDRAVKRMQRGIALATKAGVEYTPAVVFTRGREVLRSVENQDMSEAAFSSAVIAAKKEMTV